MGFARHDAFALASLNKPNGLNTRFINPKVVTELMSRQKDYTQWLKRGRQRAAVAQVLRKPLTTSEICQAAREYAPRLQLRDVWHLMQELQDRGLVTCLNPRHVTGKLYMLTPTGKWAVERAFEIKISSLPKNIDWRKYAQVARAKTRRLVLLELAHMPEAISKTASNIRKSLKSKHPLGLNPTIRALKDLQKLGLVKSAPYGDQDRRRVYRLTFAGNTISDLISLQ
jgi:DNA-binding PadR family transcriptional regulator